MKTAARSIVCGLFMLAGINGHADELQLVTLDFPPYEYLSNGEAKGAAVEVVKEAFKRMGQPVKISVLPWARAIKMVEDGAADGIFTAYKTAEREQFADYSREVLIPQIVELYVRKDAKIVFDGDIAKLSGYKFGLVRAISYGDKIDGALKNKTIGNTEAVNDAEPNFLKLLNARVDIVPSNKYVAVDVLNKLKKLDEVKALSPEVQNVPSYLAFSKKKNLSATRDRFDETLKKMKAEGAYDKIIGDFFRAKK